MDIERFRKSPSGRLIQTGEGRASYWAFVPNPLPPELNLDAKLVRTLSDADRALGELAGLGRTVSNPQLLAVPFMHREAVLSSRIEGTQADIEDLYAYQAGQLDLPGFEPAPPESDVREVLNYVRALRYGIERLESLPVSLRLMRELHERLVEGVRGEVAYPDEFRRSQNWIGEPGSTLNDATYVPPPVSKMHEALDAFEKYVHTDDPYPPLIRLAFIHYQFEAIHPFIDGNGRIGRLLISLLLIRWNLLPVPLLYLSVFFERNRQTYYDLLYRVSAEGAWRQWVEFFLRGVAEQAQDAVIRAKQLQDVQNRWRDELQERAAPGWYFGLLDTLFDQPLLSATEVQTVFDVTHPTAMRALKWLEEGGILREVTGRERNQLYLAEEILRILM